MKLIGDMRTVFELASLRLGFPVVKTIESFDFSLQAQLPKAKLLDLLDGRFIADNINPIFVGPTGVGKTHVLTASESAHALPAIACCSQQLPKCA